MPAGIAFVGSTLPCKILKNYVLNGKISQVWVSNSNLLYSLDFIKKYVPSLSVRVIPSNRLFHFILILYIILKCRIFKRQVFFFHESCWTILDVLLLLLTPNGYYIPQTNLNSFSKLSQTKSNEYFRKKYSFILALIIQKYFNVYSAINDGGNDKLYVISVIKYPSTIIYLRESLIYPDSKVEEGVSSNTVLFIVGSDAVNSDELKRIYHELIEMSLNLGYKVIIKDHPNLNSRLNLRINNICVSYLDPYLPAELLSENFSSVVGVASAALSTFGKKAISILNILEGMEIDVKKIRRNYIISINPEIHFLNTKQEFNLYLENRKI